MADAPAHPEHGSAALEAGRLLFAQSCDFIIGCARLDQVPNTDLPEIAFAGRSNVGKSSLINTLVGQKALARTSNTPGRTQQINFFDLGGRLMIADLPGYGYARAPKAQVQKWTFLVQSYLVGRANLRRILVLVDARHGLKDNDRSVMMVLDKAAQPYQVVLTKADKIKPRPLTDLQERIEKEAAKHPAAHPHVMVTSSQKGLGIAELRAELTALTGS